MTDTSTLAAQGTEPEVPKFRRVDFADPLVDVERRPDGVLILRSPRPLGDYERTIVTYLRQWSEEDPERLVLAQRAADRSWRRLTYGAMREQVDRVGQALLDRGLGPERPVMILSGNSLEHAILTFAGMTVGVPVAPVSVAYSLMSRDFSKLRHVFDLVEPGMLFVQNGRLFEPALKSLPLDGVEVVVAEGPGSLPATPFASLLEARPGAGLEAAYAAVGPDTVAKILFTSGSTGMPKGVINTQRMLCANTRMAEITVRPDPDVTPVLLDWLPWNHTFGGNYNVNNCIRQGGVMYIDAGRPIPGMFDETIANLREVSPTYYASAPVGYTMLLPTLEAEDDLRERFFRNLRLVSYGGASLPQELWDRFQELSIRTIGVKVPFITGWGSTETAPTATTLHWLVDRPGIIGLPYPSVELKMVPLPGDEAAGKYELRVRGPIVTPGYLKRPDLTAEAFDEEGFYRIGDAGRLVDPDAPHAGLSFEGRVSEDFKLQTGTWVQVSSLRVVVLDAVAPLLQDVVVAGEDRPYVAVLAWPNIAACRARLGSADDVSPAALLGDPRLIEALRRGLQAHNATVGSSGRVERLLLMAEPPSIDANEITDKGYVNQRATLAQRAALVQRLYAEPPAEGVIVIQP